jgi:nitrogen fixation protein NifB
LRVAVTSETGRLVDAHFGRADVFMIYEVDSTGSRLLERRVVEEVEDEEGVAMRIQRLVELIADCDAVVTSRVGPHAQELLDARGILGVQYALAIEKGLAIALHEWQEQNPGKPIQ